MTSGPLKPSMHDARYTIPGQEEQKPKSIEKTVQTKTNTRAKKSLSAPASSERTPLGNVKKMLTFALNNRVERLLDDADFVTIVTKGTEEIIQAVHKTKDVQVVKQHIKKFVRCEEMLEKANNKLSALIKRTSSKNLEKRKKINHVIDTITQALFLLKEEKAFINTIEKGSHREDDFLPDHFVESREPADIPADVIGVMASYLPGQEPEMMLDPLLDQFAKKSEREAVKKRASEEAYKAKEVSKAIREALKKQGDAFVFPEELKKKIKDVTSLDLSQLEVPLSAKALQEINTHWPHIMNLNVAYTRMTQEAADVFQELKNLRHLDISGPHMTDEMFAAVANCVTLQSLDCRNCDQITSLEPLESCPLLQHLICRDCINITSLEPLEQCPLLRSLDFQGCWGINNLEPLESCPLLQSLNCSGCREINNLEPLESCPLLQSLNCSTCWGITYLEPLKQCPLLQSLNCLDNRKITSLEPLEYCPQLQYFICNDCTNITSLEPLGYCPLLQSLHCSCCVQLTSLEPLEYCPLLQSLDCAACREITNLEPLEYCPLLQSLDCSHCIKITSLESLEYCSLLQSLDCSGCQQITSLESLESCPLLQNLYCRGCAQITSLEPLESCPLLQSLDCSHCIKITSLEPLKFCPQLRRLNCNYCDKISSLEPLKSCSWLRELHARECAISAEEKAALKQVLPLLELVKDNEY